MPDRPYQTQLFTDVRRAIVQGHRRILVVLPTGGGKGYLAARMLEMAAAKGSDSIFFAAQRELIFQLSKQLERLSVPSQITMAGVENEFQSGQEFMASTMVRLIAKDTLWSRGFKRKTTPIPPAKIVHYDEAHGSLAKTTQVMLEHFGESIIIGWTATPCRSDNKPLGSFYDCMVKGATYKELQDDGFLVPCRVIAPDRPDLKGLSASRGDYAKAALEKRMNRDEMVGSIIDEWKKHSEKRSTVCFAAGVAHSIHIRDQFLSTGVSAEHVDGKTEDTEREDIMGRVADGTTTVLCNYGVATTGVDIPRLKYMVCARPTKSFGLWRQMCLDQETEVLTEAGWLGIEDTLIVSSLKVATVKEDHSIEFRYPQNVFSKPASESEAMFAIKGQRTDIRVTGNHDLIFTSLRKQNVWKKLSASDLSQKRGSYCIPVSGVQESSGVPLSDSELRFLGWFYSDGGYDVSNNQITISQSTAKPQRFHDSIKNAIQGCGFKFGTHQRKRKGKWEKYKDGIEYTISKGMPRAVDKHLTGWGRLEDYIVKSGFPWRLNAMTGDQLSVFLETFNLGDGRTSDQGYDRNTMEIAKGDKELMESLQILCVLRGFMCNLRIDHYNKSPLYTLSISKRLLLSIGGSNAINGRVKLERTEIEPNERVWCMTTEHGSLITRRSGKVAIVGNCGRIQRPFEDHKECVIQDHSDNCLTFGYPDEDVDWVIDGDSDIAKTHAERKKKENKGAQPFACEKCKAVYTGPHCPNCGHKPERKGEDLEMSTERLKELERVKANKVATIDDKQKFWDACLGQAIGKRLKVGAAAHRYKDRFGVWPTHKLKNVPRNSQWQMQATEFYHDIVKPAKQKAEAEYVKSQEEFAF